MYKSNYYISKCYCFILVLKIKYYIQNKENCPHFSDQMNSHWETKTIIFGRYFSIFWYHNKSVKKYITFILGIYLLCYVADDKPEGIHHLPTK